VAFLIKPQSLLLLKQEITLLLIFLQLCPIQGIFFHERAAKRGAQFTVAGAAEEGNLQRACSGKIYLEQYSCLREVGWVSKLPEDRQSPSLSYQVSPASLYSDNIILLIKSRQNFVMSTNSLLIFRLIFSVNDILPDTLLRDTGEA